MCHDTLFQIYTIPLKIERIIITTEVGSGLGGWGRPRRLGRWWGKCVKRMERVASVVATLAWKRTLSLSLSPISTQTNTVSSYDQLVHQIKSIITPNKLALLWYCIDSKNGNKYIVHLRLIF